MAKPFGQNFPRPMKDGGKPNPYKYKRYASGTINLTSGSMTISGLSFTPSIILFYLNDPVALGGDCFMVFRHKKMTGTASSVIGMAYLNGINLYASNQYGVSWTEAPSYLVVNADGITFQCQFNVNNCRWVALE